MLTDQTLRILFVEDMPTDMELAERILRKEGLAFVSQRVESKPDLLEALSEFQPDLVISDYSLPAFDGMQALSLTLEYDPQLPVIILTGSINEMTAVGCMKAGATDYVIKENLTRLPLAVHSALEQKAMRQSKAASEQALHESEERYRLMVENVTTGIVVHVNNSIVYANPVALKLIGARGLEEMLAANMLEFVHPDERAKILELIQNAFAPEHPDPAALPQAVEERLIRLDGSIITVEASAVVINYYGAPALLVMLNDISERKRSERILRDREAQYRAVIETSSDGFWMFDAEGRIFEVNDAYARRSGYQRDELLGMHISDLEAKERPKEILTHIQNVMRHGGDLFETLHRAKDGSVWPVEISVSSWSIGGGWCFAFARDITERKRMEEDLRQTNQVLAAIIENSPLAIDSLDNENRVTLWSPAAERLFGWPAEEVLGKEPPNIPEEMRAYVDQQLSIRKGGESITLQETRRLRKDGSNVDVHISTAPLYNARGEITGSMAIFADITARKRAEQALAESEEQYRSLVESSPDAIGIVTDGVLVFANQASARIFGADSPQDLIGTPLADRIPPENRGESLGRMRAAGRGKAIPYIEQQLKKLNGDRVDVETFMIPFQYQGWPSFQIIARDISERKQAQADLQFRNILLSTQQDASIDGILVVDEHKRILSYNRRFIEIWGIPEKLVQDKVDEPVLNSVKDAVADPESFLRRVQYLYDHTQEIGQDELILTDGRTIERYSAPMVGSEGRYLGRVWFFRDISERKRSEESLRQSLVEAEALYTVSAVLRTAQNIGEALPVLLDQTLSALNCSEGAIWLHQPASASLRVVIARGWFRQLYDVSLGREHGIAGAVFNSGQVYQSADLANDPLATPPPDIQIPAGKAAVCVPIRTAEETVGVLMLSFPAPRRLSGENIKLLNSLAELGGSALNRIRLHEDTVRHLEQLQALRAIDQLITSSLDLRQILTALLEHITRRLNVDAASVLLIQSPTSTLNFAAGRGFHTRAIESTRMRLGEGLPGQVALERKSISHTLEAEDESKIIRKALVDEEHFIAYYGVPLIAQGVVKGVLEIFHRSELNPDGEWINFLETLAGQAAIAIDNSQLFENLQQANTALSVAYDATIEGWSHALDLRDKETEGHTQRVTEMTLKLAEQMGLSQPELTSVRWGALLHDIGKMGIPDQILLKPGPLNDEEWVIMRQHPRYAFDLLIPITYLGHAVDIPYCHHEKWDGTGYPRGLKGEEIPLMARIFSIIDVWDALRSDRPYRSAWPKEKALQYILDGKGTSFDPKVVETFVVLLENEVE